MTLANDPNTRRPLGLVISGETRRHVEVLRKLLGPELVSMLDAGDMAELLGIVQHGAADAVVVDSDRGDQELLRILRMIRRVDWALPVILVAREVSRRFLEGALRLEAFSVAHKPLEREDLLIQLQRIMERFYPRLEPGSPPAGDLGGTTDDAAGRPPVIGFGHVVISSGPLEQTPPESGAAGPRPGRCARRTFHVRFTRLRPPGQDRQ